MNNKIKNKINKNIIFIILLLLPIIILGSFYLGKVYAPSEIGNNVGIEKKSEEFRSIGSYTINEFKKKIDEDYILIDLRTPGEIKEGYIGGLDLKLDYYNDNFKTKIEKLDKTKKYLIYCRSGSRSGNTLYLMKNLGFKNVHDLTGGISSWKRSGGKVVK